jgi:hypothetical protein
LIVVHGQPWEATAELAVRLADDGIAAEPPDLLIWDERDADGRWAGRSSTFEVRTRPVRRILDERGRPSLGARAGNLEVRAFLWQRRHRNIAIVGHAALDASPWLRHHRGQRIWLATGNDLPALRAGLAVPSIADGGPHHVLATELELHRSEQLRGEPRHRWQPGFTASRPSSPARPEILAIGPPCRAEGIDLVGRAVASRRDALRHLGARVRWITPPGAEIPQEEVDDLRRAGVEDLFELVPSDDPEGTLRTRLAGAAALVLCGRPGATTPNDETLVRAYRCGVRTIGFPPGAPPDLAIDPRWSQVPLADVSTVGGELVAAVRASEAERLPGPIGLDALFQRLGTKAGDG